jgi:hypothetical protein
MWDMHTDETALVSLENGKERKTSLKKFPSEKGALLIGIFEVEFIMDVGSLV